MSAEREPILELVSGSVRFPGKGGVPFEAISDVSLSLRPGEILGLVGESGCGKSTTARALMGLQSLSSGEVRLRGEAVPAGRRGFGAAVQAIFQNPAGSFNPKRSLLDSVAEPLRVHKRGDASARRKQALAELARVGISESMAERRPTEVSGGQCQRAAIARATILRPEVLICDEPVSALDVSVQAQILELLDHLRSDQGLAMLFISHDLSVVATLCDRTAVMYAGAVIEEGETADVTHSPQHPYTAILHDAVPSLSGEPRKGSRLEMVTRDRTLDGRQQPGCRFAAMCPRFAPDCDTGRPPLGEGRHRAACIHPLSSSGSMSDGGEPTAIPNAVVRSDDEKQGVEDD